MGLIDKGDRRIAFYQYCATCFEVVKSDGDGQPVVIDHGMRYSWGWTPEGLQIICEGCGTVVLDLDFEGRQIKWYEPPGVT